MIVVSRVRRVARPGCAGAPAGAPADAGAAGAGGTSMAQRLERGVSALRTLTVNRFSMRSFSSRSTVSAVTK